ncbi:carotenoid cleavage dioxygenase [Rhodococcus sp. OK611]|uniref:carotenoid oxygenase family protein n=1 Tax=unclassified Rhodococcus (in: high G+C Gram-positive bacteria) TaxID=192944 RepID=UPI000BCC21EC|nr:MULTISPECIES: carotenoid oxygenase family protein [unclassified Rhodococcus (in: high G+C Gram-positive bacteria)]PTR43137.1 carotenoid cleavage dioxygenase [Rhodococcus sp. OK611]SNX91001.1 carotenoid cleavage dioxygenase [Rhodococcus sp. OK270]
MNAPSFPRPAPVDLAHHSHLTGIFEPQREEVDVRGLEIVGELPSDLRGAYLRNGPNPRFDPIGRYVYPLDGDGMVHRIELADGAARYTNRFVRTPMVVAEEKVGHAIWAGVTDLYTPSEAEVGPELAGTPRELPDINVVRHSGRLMAMAETTRPYLLDPADLRTLGPESCDGAMAVGSTAHPKIAPTTGELVLFNYLLDPPYLTWSVVAADGSLARPPTPVAGMDKALMIHDMALTGRYIVLLVCPLAFDMAGLLTGGSVLDWRPDDGTRVALIPRDGGPVRWASCEAFWVWHFANGFDLPDGRVSVDYAQWSYPGGFADADHPNVGTLMRAVIDPETGAVQRTAVSDRDVEFPRIDDRSLTRGHGTVATVGKLAGPEGPMDSLWFFGPSGSEAHWDPGSLTVGEPVFMPGAAHDYWGMIGTDRADMSSWFCVLPAEDPGSGPLGRARLPLRVPAGLHGAWLPA